MARPKIARKSTWVDMTAFCDVAFLLLSFFIMATKTKPPEAVSVMMPSSVSSKAVEEKDQVMIILNQQGKVFISLSEPERRQQVAKQVAELRGVPLSPADIKKAGTTEFFGSPISQLASFINLPKEQMKGELLPGIPAKDTATSEIKYWMMAVSNVFQGEKLNLLVKGDNAAKYPSFKQVLDAFKQHDEFLKFSIITNSEGLPSDSEYAKELRKKK